MSRATLDVFIDDFKNVEAGDLFIPRLYTDLTGAPPPDAVCAVIEDAQLYLVSGEDVIEQALKNGNVEDAAVLLDLRGTRIQIKKEN